MAKLTDRAVEVAKCPPGKRDVLLFDSALKGFGLRVTAKGKKLFLFQYRAGDRVRRASLGEWGQELTATQARRKAETMRGQVVDGRDPLGERETAAAKLAAARVQAALVAASNAYTVDVLIRDWTADRLSQRSASYRLRVPREMHKALKQWLPAPAASFGRVGAVQVLDTIAGSSGPVAANRLRAEARACWSWAVKRGTIEVNPWEATPRPLERETPRERVLSGCELSALYAAADDLNEPFGALIRMLILTGQRRGEVSGMLWSELDLVAGTWSLPGARTKNHRPHVVPLVPVVISVLRAIKRREGATFVFEGPRKTAVSGFGRIKKELDIALRKANEVAGRPSVSWVLHDFRRSCATGLQRLGVRLEVIEAVLNHVSGTRSGIVGVYQRHGWEREKAQALEAWAAHLVETGSEKGSGKILQMRRS